MDNSENKKINFDNVKFASNKSQKPKPWDVSRKALNQIHDKNEKKINFNDVKFANNGPYKPKPWDVDRKALDQIHDKGEKPSVTESLERLNVSEECFNGILESIFKTINNKIQDPKKREELTNKACVNLARERYSSQNRDFAGKDKYEARELMDAKRNRTKNGLADEDV